MNEGSFKGVAGCDIFTRAWRPAAEKPKAIIIIVHGFNAHSGQYQWVAEQLVAHGFAVHALDLRGRGKSGGERFYVDKFEEYAGDVAAFVRIVKSQEPGLAVFLLGHSAGGVVSCIYALDNQSELNGFICEDFAYELPAPSPALTVLKGLSHVAPHVHVLKLKNEDFSRDPEVVAAMNADPLIANEVQPTQTLAAMVRADERLKKEFPRITLPLLIIHGTADKAAKSAGSQHFYDQAGSKDKTLKFYEGYYHDPLHDLGKQLVLEDIVHWVEDRIPMS